MAYFISGNCGGLRVGSTDFTQINGVITLAANTALVGDPFLAECGGQKFDGGVFKSVKVNGKDVITTVGSTADSYFATNCSLLFDADVFELGDDAELILI